MQLCFQILYRHSFEALPTQDDVGVDQVPVAPVSVHVVAMLTPLPFT